jgi:DNA-binding transcriptional LysR family regulator
MPSLKLDQLRSFALVVEHGSFSAAADRLDLTQPAVSLQLRQLEARLGVRLIERVGKRATPTAAGIELARHARRIEAAVAAALDAMAAYAEAKGRLGRVRLGAGATACIYLLPPILRDLKRRLPGLEITVRTGNTADMLKALEANELDVALVTLPAPGRMFEVTTVLSDPLLAVGAAPGEGLPRPATPAALAKLPLVLYEAGGNTRRLIDGWFAKAGIRARPAMALGSAEAIKELVAAGLGSTVLPESALGDASASARFVTRPLSPPLRRELAIVLRRDKALVRGLRETLKALRQLG